MSEVKIHGCMRSGTNYARWLLEHNFGVQYPGGLQDNPTGWKHGIKVLFDGPKIVVIREPLGWLVSYAVFRRGWKNMPVRCWKWGYDNRSWLEQGCVPVRYEDLPHALNSLDFLPPRIAEVDTDLKLGYYGATKRETFVPRPLILPEEHWAAINEHVDWDLAMEFGYASRRPASGEPPTAVRCIKSMDPKAVQALGS